MANVSNKMRDWKMRQGIDPKAAEAARKRIEQEPMVQDMERFQRGEMTAAEFAAKWDPFKSTK